MSEVLAVSEALEDTIAKGRSLKDKKITAIEFSS